jgi:cytochrome c-type biogenesis protein CcmH/NrfG
MLLNRQRVKFWQRIIFGAMAALMAGFLIFGYSGVASGCRNGSVVNTGNSTLDQQAKAAQAALKKNPNDPTALLQMAQVYQGAGAPQSGAVSSGQVNDLVKALGYYGRYLALPDSALGAAATGLRFAALQNEAAIYTWLVDYKDAAATYKKMLKLRPHDDSLYAFLGSSAAAAGETAQAIGAWETLLKRFPNSQYAAQVKVALANLKATASPSPSATTTGRPSPSPSATK